VGLLSLEAAHNPSVRTIPPSRFSNFNPGSKPSRRACSVWPRSEKSRSPASRSRCPATLPCWPRPMAPTACPRRTPAPTARPTPRRVK